MSRARAITSTSLALGLLLLMTVACDSGIATATPDDRPPFMPVVFVPGITGSQLAAIDGHILWPPGGPDATTTQLIFSESIKDDFR